MPVCVCVSVCGLAFHNLRPYDPPHHHQPRHDTTARQKYYGIPNTRDGNTAGEKILGAAAALAVASGSAQADGTCRVANEPELRAAITVR